MLKDPKFLVFVTVATMSLFEGRNQRNIPKIMLYELLDQKKTEQKVIDDLVTIMSERLQDG